MYWNEEHKIIGYHRYEEGKARDFYHQALISGEMRQEFVDYMQTQGRLVFIPWKGALIGTTAVARLPGTDLFIRAHANLNVKEDRGLGSKKRGREMATGRIVKLINWHNKHGDITQMENELSTALQHDIIDNKLEIVTKEELRIRERRAMGVDRDVPTDA